MFAPNRARGRRSIGPRKKYIKPTAACERASSFVRVAHDCIPGWSSEQCARKAQPSHHAAYCRKSSPNFVGIFFSRVESDRAE